MGVMCIQHSKLAMLILVLMCVGVVVVTPTASAISTDDALNEKLSAVLIYHGFTGRVGLSLEQRLGRKIDNRLADLGRLAFHDTLLGLNDDNSCSGCHSAPLGFGDSQSIAIGVENNNVVGPA
jgi:cytochrome c peroxidase